MKNSQLRKMLCLLLAAVMMLSLCACGGRTRVVVSQAEAASADGIRKARSQMGILSISFRSIMTSPSWK